MNIVLVPKCGLGKVLCISVQSVVQAILVPGDPFLESPGNVSGQESCFMLAIFPFKIEFSCILRMIQWSYQWTKQNCLPTCIFLFLPSSFGIEKIDTFIRSLSFIENLPRLQTLYHFQTKTAQKPYPMGRHAHTYGLYKVVPRILCFSDEDVSTYLPTEVDFSRSCYRSIWAAPFL